MKALIVDDERLVRESLKALIEKYCPSITAISFADNLPEAHLKIENESPDILFLDIHIYESDGLKLLELLPQKSFHTIIISGDATRGIDAIKMGVVDYLLKPIDIFELQRAVSKIKQLNRSYRDNYKISVADKQSYRLLSPDSIVRIEAYSNYSKIFLNDNKSIIASRTLKRFAEKLKDHGFFRAHKSHLVNVSCISSYSKNTLDLMLIDGTCIPVSRKSLSELIERLSGMNNYRE